MSSMGATSPLCVTFLQRADRQTDTETYRNNQIATPTLTVHVECTCGATAVRQQRLRRLRQISAASFQLRPPPLQLQYTQSTAGWAVGQGGTRATELRAGGAGGGGGGADCDYELNCT